FIPTNPSGTGPGLRDWSARADAAADVAGTATASAQAIAAAKSIPADRLHHDIGASVFGRRRQRSADYGPAAAIGPETRSIQNAPGRAASENLGTSCATVVGAERATA